MARRSLTAIAAVALALILVSLPSAQAAPAPILREHIAPGTSLDLNAPFQSAVLHAVVVRPGIAVATSSDAGVDPQFLANVKVLLDTIETTEAGKTLIKGLGDIAPLQATADDEARLRAIYFRDTATYSRTDINVVIQPGWWQAQAASRAEDGYGAVASVFADPQSMVTYRNPGQAGSFEMTPDMELFHELVHAAHYLSGSRAPISAEVEVPGVSPLTGQHIIAHTPVEEARTHGAPDELFAANGGTTRPDGTTQINANPLETRSLEMAAHDLTDALAVLRSRTGNTTFNQGVAKAAGQTLAARQMLAGLTERQYVTERGLMDRVMYVRPYDEPDRSIVRLDSPADVPAFIEQLNSRKQAVQSDPESTGLGMRRGPTPGPCHPLGVADACDATFDTSELTDEQQRTWDTFDQSVKEHGDPVVERAAEAVVGDLSPPELAAYAKTRVTADIEPGFTGDLAEAYRSGKVFVPTGEATASRLAEGWRFANSAAVGVNVVLWIKGLVEAFESDSSDLDRSTVALAMVPAVGQILGILDGLEHKDPASVVSNVTALLSFALDFVGQPELALVFGVVSFVTAIVDTFLSMDANDPRYQSYASWNIESRRDGVWKSQVAKGLLEKTIPALVTAADAAFQRAQREVLYSGYMALASIDAGVADAGVAQRNAAVTAKGKIRAAMAQSVDSLRTGFVSGTEGVEAAIRTAVTKLNAGDGFGDFTHDYLQKVERPDYILAMRTGCQNGDSQTDDIPDEAQTLPCDQRDPYYGDHFDDVVEPGIQTSAAPGGLVPQTYVDAVDAEIAKQGAFQEMGVDDTDPTLVDQSVAAPIASDLNGVCLGSNGARSQVWTVDPASCADHTWTVNTNHSITDSAGLCLDANGWGTAPGTAVTAYTCTGGLNQWWTFHRDGTITNDFSGLCLDVTAGASAPGAGVELWTCNDRANQRWAYLAAPDAFSQITTTLDNRGLTMDPSGRPAVSTWGSSEPNADQQWTFVSADNSSGRLENAYDGTCLQAQADQTVTFAKCDAASRAQQWALAPARAGALQIRSLSNDRCLDAAADVIDDRVTLAGCSVTHTNWRILPNLTSNPGPQLHTSGGTNPPATAD